MNTESLPYQELFQGKKVLIIGLGRNGGGIGLAAFASRRGAQVTVSDRKTQIELKESVDKLKEYSNITFHFGDLTQEDVLSADLIFKGPSVPWKNPLLVKALDKGIPIEMEASFVAAHTKATLIGITGTRGKSTTTQLIYETLKAAGKPVYLGGNVTQVSTIALLERAKEGEYIVMELSSYQLSGFHTKKISPHIAVLTNLYPDHLDYYDNMEDYFYDKSAIYLYQKPGDVFIASAQTQAYLEMNPSPVAPTIYRENNFAYSMEFLLGKHNKENAAAALMVAKEVGISEEDAVQTITQFSGLPFRQQNVGEKNGVIFINDSASTTPVALVTALKTFQDNPVTLIMGGNDKNLPYEELLLLLPSVKNIVLLKGSFTDKILPQLQKLSVPLTEVYDDFEAAIQKAYDLASKESKPGYVLFSPGATSFAMFKHEFHRGEEFNRIVENLI